MTTAQGIEVRAATVADRGALVRLLGADLVERRVEATGAGGIGEAVERAVELALASTSAAWLVVATAHSMVAGVLLANPAVSTSHGGALLRVEVLFVAPERRRRGIALALARHVANEARLNGMGALELEYDPDSSSATAAAGLCASLGATSISRARNTLRL